MERTKVLVIEDNRLLREGIAAALDTEPDSRVVAIAEDGDAIQRLKEAGESPDCSCGSRILESAPWQAVARPAVDPAIAC